MAADSVSTKVLITVKTYPHPSHNYQELACIAGITENQQWVRLYPVDFRYRPKHQQFKKYQWIQVDLAPHGYGNDRRAESRRPVLDSIELLGEPLPTKDGWLARRTIIDTMPHHTVKQLESLYEKERVSLGIVRPSEVLDVVVSPADPEWKPKWQSLFSQLRLFGDQQKPLRKLPYKFQYVFRCGDSDKCHKAMIEDWELGTLFLKEIDRLGSEKNAAESVRAKYYDELCGPDRDTRFFMGTRLPYNTWLVLGVFWPPKIIEQPITLFD